MNGSSLKWLIIGAVSISVALIVFAVWLPAAISEGIGAKQDREFVKDSHYFPGFEPPKCVGVGQTATFVYYTNETTMDILIASVFWFNSFNYDYNDLFSGRLHYGLYNPDDPHFQQDFYYIDRDTGYCGFFNVTFNGTTPVKIEYDEISESLPAEFVTSIDAIGSYYFSMFGGLLLFTASDN
jgi:hypothetical protein